MDQEHILQKTREFIRNKIKDETSGHDWWHIERVTKTALLIGNKEKADLFLVELGVLLHDLDDFKFTVNPEAASNTRKWLRGLDLPLELIEQICAITTSVSYKGVGVTTIPATLEGKIVQDADRLDALGAIGIARTFVFGGTFKRPLYDPQIKPILHQNFESYKTDKTTTINHFYEKLLLLKDRLHTKTAKAIATPRDKYMKDFLEEFLGEWEGKR